MIKNKYAKNKKSGKIYEVLMETGAVMKNPETREWSSCVIYREDAGEHPGLTFCRERDEFWEKFSELSEESTDTTQTI